MEFDSTKRKVFLLLIGAEVIFLLSLIVQVILVVLIAMEKIHCESVKMVSDTSTLLSFLALAFAISIATPYFISKKEISKKIGEYTKKEYKVELLSTAENAERTDAHLSRMIAFNLLEEGYYYWAIGWGFGALKRYSKLGNPYKLIYDEFCQFIFNEIIIRALDESVSNADKSIDRFPKDQKSIYESEEYRIKLRAVKDYIDFKFDQQVIKNLHSNDTIKKIDEKMKILILDLYEKLSSEKNVNYRKNIDEEIFKLSSFRDMPIEYENFFYEKIWYSVFSERNIEEKRFATYRNKMMKLTGKKNKKMEGVK